MTLHRMIFCLCLALATVSNALNAAPQDLQHTLYLDTKDGRVTILLRPDLAPKHVAQIEALTKRGFYNGLV
ncbi:MAG: peptidylprolyl isomerase, partial [Methylocella sp.]